MSPTIPKTCKAVVLESVGAPWTIKEVSVPTPAENEVLIKVAACGVCHSDLFLQSGAFGDFPSFPRIPGHEVIGTVVAVGDHAKQWKVGDKVGGGWHGGHDGTCKSCMKAFPQGCVNQQVNGITRDGGYSEYCTLRAEAAIRIPEDVDPAEYAPLLCAGVTVFNSMRRMNVPQGEIIAVQGLGGLGHLAIQYARKMGYRTVALSRGEAKKEFALKLGANDYIDTNKEDAAAALQKMGGAGLIVVTAPNKEVMAPLLHGCAPLGKLLCLADVGELPVSTGVLIMKGVSVHGWPVGHALDCEETISFAQNQNVTCMIEKFPMDKVEEAVQKVHDNKIRFRAVLTME